MRATRAPRSPRTRAATRATPAATRATPAATRATPAATPEGIDAPRAPGVGLLHTEAQLDFMRAHAGVEPWASAVHQVLDEAEAALARTPTATEDFDIPFYYGDPAASQAAKEGLRQDAMAAYACALGYQLAGTREQREAYAAKSVEILSAWAGVNHSVSGSDGPLVVIYTGIPLLYAADLVANDDAFDAASRAAFLAWVDEVFSPSASSIKDHVNNWGDWGTLGVVAADALHGDAAALASEAERIKVRIGNNINAAGELPEENKRTNSGMWYTFFALTSMTTAAQIIENATGQDLFSYTSPEGRSFALALAREFHYAEHPDEWPYHLPAGIAGDAWRLVYPCDDTVQMPTPSGWPGSLFEVMSDRYQQPDWESWVSGSRPQHGWHGWIYSTLMRQSP